jgi:hypothetical protein
VTSASQPGGAFFEEKMDNFVIRLDLVLILIVIITLLLIVKQQAPIEVVLVWLRHKRKK